MIVAPREAALIVHKILQTPKLHSLQTVHSLQTRDTLHGIYSSGR
jgi:hypothetical protein